MPTQKELELPPQLEWKYAQEPELLAWTLRARPYNTFLANLALTVVTTLFFGILVIIPVLTGFYTELWLICFMTAGTLMLVWPIWDATQKKTNFAYRLTQSGMEYCEWRDFPQWMLTLLKWFTGVVLVLFIGLTVLNPAFLLGALVGPGGMALTYLALANSKSLQALETEYHHRIFSWKEITGLTIATTREVVDLKYEQFSDFYQEMTKAHFNIFCRPKKKEEIAHFIHPFLAPDIQILHGKVEIF